MVEVTDWDETETEKMVTYQVVPLGTSLYRRVDLTPVANKQTESKKLTPLVRRQLETLKRFNKVRNKHPYCDKQFFFERAIHLNYHDRLALANERWGPVGILFVNYCSKMTYNLQKKFGADWLNKGMEQWNNNRERQLHIRARNPTVETNTPVKHSWNFAKQKRVLGRSTGHNVRKKKKIIIPDNFQRNYKEAIKKNEKKIFHFPIPDFMLEDFWIQKSAAIRSKLSWKSSRLEGNNRKRTNYRSPKDLLYKQIFLLDEK